MSAWGLFLSLQYCSPNLSQLCDNRDHSATYMTKKEITGQERSFRIANALFCAKPKASLLFMLSVHLVVMRGHLYKFASTVSSTSQGRLTRD